MSCDHSLSYYLYNMRLYTLFLFLIIVPTLAFCPKRKYSYDKAIGKIMGKTWCQYRICKNGICYPPDDSLFFDGSFDDFKNYYNGPAGEDLTCITPISLTSYKNS